MSALRPQLAELQRRFPLPPGWGPPEVFEEELRLEDLAIGMLGLVSMHQDGREATASAVSADVSSPAIRAYFELLERTVILDSDLRSIADPAAPVPLLDRSGKPVGHIPVRDAMPVSTEPQVWQYSRSNGVAAHLSFEKAAHAARMELAERDRILRFWYSGKPPEPFALLDPLPEGLDSRYEVEAWRFAGQEDEPEVVGVFCFSRDPEGARIHSGPRWGCGYGAGPTVSEACSRAVREMLQRLAFLWDSETSSESSVAESAPAPRCDPDFHIDFFDAPGRVESVRHWLHRGRAPVAEIASARGSDTAIRYADLTPPALRGRVFVVRALSDCHLPLTFGMGNPKAGSRVPLGPDWVHPIA